MQQFCQIKILETLHIQYSHNCQKLMFFSLLSENTRKERRHFLATWANWRILFPSRRHRIFFFGALLILLAVVGLEWPAGTLLPSPQIWCISVTTTTLAFGGGRVWKWQGQAGHDRGGSGRGVSVACPNKRRFQMYMRGKKERRIRRFVL